MDDLIAGIQEGHPDRVRAALRAGSIVHAAGDHGWTALHWAAAAGPSVLREVTLTPRPGGVDWQEGRSPNDPAALSPYTEIVGLLLDHGADPAARTEEGVTPLMLALAHGHEAAAEVLIRRGSDLNARDGEGSSPLHFAVRKGFPEPIRLLIAGGADVNVRDRGGRTLISLAIEKGLEDAVTMLLQAGANLEDRDDEGWTPLHLAVMYGCEDLVGDLISRGADVDARGDHGLKPLHWAAREGRSAIGIRLIDAGADFNARDDDGRSPYRTAVDAGHSDFVAMMDRKAGAQPERAVAFFHEYEDLAREIHQVRPTIYAQMRRAVILSFKLGRHAEGLAVAEAALAEARREGVVEFIGRIEDTIEDLRRAKSRAGGI